MNLRGKSQTCDFFESGWRAAGIIDALKLSAKQLMI